jgi:hypothetical protein
VTTEPGAHEGVAEEENADDRPHADIWGQPNAR